jgi:hypothetical protein
MFKQPGGFIYESFLELKKRFKNQLLCVFIFKPFTRKKKIARDFPFFINKI